MLAIQSFEEEAVVREGTAAVTVDSSECGTLKVQSW